VILRLARHGDEVVHIEVKLKHPRELFAQLDGILRALDMDPFWGAGDLQMLCFPAEHLRLVEDLVSA